MYDVKQEECEMYDINTDRDHDDILADKVRRQGV